MTVEEAQAALDEAQKAFDAAKGTGVRNVTAASRALSAAKRALATAQKAEAAGVNVGGLSRAEQLSTIRQAEYTAAQEEAGRGEKPTPPPADEEYTYDYVWRSEPGGRGGYWSLVRYQKYGTQTGAGNTGTGNINTGNINTGNVDTGNVNTGNVNTGNINTGNINTGNIVTGPTLAKDVFKQTLALFFGEAELSKAWMDELYNVVSKYYRNGVAVSEALNMSLLDARNNPNLKAFTDRFKGIYALQDLRQAGKPVSVPTIAEYVAAQAGMADIFNEIGLGDIATEQFTGDLIGKGNSVSGVAEKIAKVFQRIDMAPKDIKDTLSRYFPTVDRTTLAKTILLGQKGVDQLVDELNQYDVLAAAERQGIGALGAQGKIGGVTEERAKEYARLGYSYSEILPKFGQVREVTPTVGKLAGISKAADIGQVGVEQALISGLAQPMETIKKLGEEEIGRFSGKAGRAELGLASQRRANRAF
jgi:PPE-repeat protein